MNSEKSGGTGYRVLLTGGSGFLGGALIREMLGESPVFPVRELRVLDLRPLRDSKFSKDSEDSRIRFMPGDVRDRELLAEACRGMDLVIHSAAIVDWGTRSKEEVRSVNFGGTRNVVEACLETGVGAMLYTSSLDVLYDGSPLVNVDEHTPYPERHSNAYCESKYRAEQLVMGAHGAALRTCVLRPADIYGEGDPYHMGSLINMAKSGFYVRLGDGRAKCQHVYVGNIAHAHLLAADALLKGKDNFGGKAYFITDGPPSNFFRFFDSIVEAAGYRIWPRNLWLPRWFAYALGCISESVAFLLRPVKKYSPKMSRFAVTYTCTDYTFSSGRAREDFNFVPKYGEKEAFERTAAHFRR
jgi:nucleoside-diphosphate-sugar epimerase